MPENAVWGRVANGAVIEYVDKAYGGDWGPYVYKWERRLRQATDILNRNSILAFTNAGLRLSGDALAGYVEDIRERVEVTRCLAAVAAAGRWNGSTFAGTLRREGS